ncbi:MAG TPA: D-alanine--D-alanine ligase [Candidatus Saccharimonadales bacterium]|nr:D-alanine--D-alanine ligase [Candidatus Saccharimonadales bacterium]
MKILVLGGGDSPERAVSLRSAAAVAGALRQAGYEVDEFDPGDGLAGPDKIAPDTMVFPILHGSGGEDGFIQAELEKRHLPYLGTKSKESKLCFDKGLTRKRLEEAGIPIARGALVDRETYPVHDLAKKQHVLKVSRGGSSIGTYIVRNPADIDEKSIEDVFSLGGEAVIEQLIEGSEITVPILDGSALPVIEIRPPEDQEFDYENKYNGRTQEICPPESVDSKTQAAASKLAEKVHKALGARHLSRVDLIVRNDGSMVVLELNTIPGMTEQSLFPKSAAVAGIPMSELVKRFVSMVRRDYNMSHE